MISLLKYVDGPWEAVRGFLRQDLDHLEAAINQRWGKVFGDGNHLKAGTIPGDSSQLSRYVSNSGTGRTLLWSLVNLANGVTGRVTFANLPSVSASRLLGRGSASSGDVQELTVGTGLALTGTVLSGLGTSVQDGNWTPLTNGNAASPDLIYDGSGDVIAVWTTN